MKYFSADALSVAVNFEKGEIASLVVRGRERLGGRGPLFRVQLRDQDGNSFTVSAYDALYCSQLEDGALYTDFGTKSGHEAASAISVRVLTHVNGGDVEWRIAAEPNDERIFVEWVDFPLVRLPALKENNAKGTGGEILFPYNEGALISDWSVRQETSFRYQEPEYPSKGSYMVFPNMMFAQMMAYLWKDAGLYIGAHDERRAVKGIDFLDDGNGVEMRLRLFCGVDFGERYESDFPVAWTAVDGAWECAAERYRSWLEGALPPKVRKITENDALPEWYADEPLVVAYPVRGIYDRDDMTPNRMYPYTQALPKLKRIQDATNARLLALLMHWEGTAPWAPPYVWPPFGDGEAFGAFRSALREQGNLLGVYCSGFGYTVQSCMIPEYNRQAEYEEKNLSLGMCAAPDGEVAISRICTMQRSGYDICPASEVGKKLLAEAYTPLLRSGLDYAQILDQNHGGGQYFCYSRNHGHAPAPGAWMTERMQTLLTEWNECAGKMLLGSESGAAEPFIGNLLFSDNRYELNYMLGRPIPLYAYLYHEYLRNFMGNQVSCPLHEQEDENLWYRLAYSFSIGDCMTLVLDQDGRVKSRWGKLKTDHVPNQDKIFRLVANLTNFYREQGKPYLYAGRMLPAMPVACEALRFDRRDVAGRAVILPAILTSAWESPEGKRAQILVNPTERVVSCTVCGETISLDPMNARLIPWKGEC